MRLGLGLSLTQPRRGPAVNILDGLVAAWLEDPATSLTADSSGNGHTLTNNGVTESGGYADFDGTDQWLLLADAAVFRGSDPFTIAGEFTFDTAAAQPLVNKGTAGGTGWSVRVATQKAGRTLVFECGSVATTETLLSTETNYKFVAWYDGTTAWLSLDDGDAAEAPAASFTPATDALLIGTDSDSAYLDGGQKKLRFWSRVLTEAERLVATDPLADPYFPPAGPDVDVSAAWSGAVSRTGATAAHVLAGDTAGARLVVSTNSDLSGPVYSSRADSEDSAVRHTITGLSPGTTYHYGLEVAGVVKDTKKGSFRTLPAAATTTLRVASVHCHSGTTAGSILAAVAALSPLPHLLLVNGDLHYGASDGAATEADLLADVAGNLNGTHSRPLYQTVPALWGSDDSDGGTNGLAPYCDEAVGRAVLKRCAPIPASAFASADHRGFSYSFPAGALTVRVLCPDNRGEADAAGQWSAAQLQWLKDQFTAAAAASEFVLLMHSNVWLGSSSDSWPQARHAQRRELADHILSCGMGRRTWVDQGDGHGQYADSGLDADYSTGGGCPLPTFSAGVVAGANSTKGGPYDLFVDATRDSQAMYYDLTDNGDGTLTVGVTMLGETDGELSPDTTFTHEFTLPSSAPTLDWLTVVQECHAYSTTAGTSHDFTLASGPVAGNLLLLHVFATAGSSTITAPAGWLEAGEAISATQVACRTFWKIASGSEGTSLSVTLGSSRTCSAHLIEFGSGFNTAGPVGRVVTTNTTASVNTASGTVTPGTDDEVALAFVCVGGIGLAGLLTGWTGGVVGRRHIAAVDTGEAPRFAGAKVLGDAGAGESLGFDWPGTARPVVQRIVTVRKAGAAGYAGPSYKGQGAVFAASGAASAAYPAVVDANDIALLFVESANEAVSTPTGFAAVTNSPQSTGTAPGTPDTATRLSVFWKRCAGTEAGTTVAVADSGDHQTGVILTFAGCTTSGDPWDATAGDALASAGTGVTVPGLTTTVPNCLIVAACTRADDSATAAFSAWANASLADVQERFDGGGNSGNGGGVGIATGEKAVAGSVDATTATSAVSTVQARLAVALKP